MAVMKTSRPHATASCGSDNRPRNQTMLKAAARRNAALKRSCQDCFVFDKLRVRLSQKGIASTNAGMLGSQRFDLRNETPVYALAGEPARTVAGRSGPQVPPSP